MGAFDERDLGVFTSRLVRDDEQAILLVFHEENGDWQFLSSNEEREEEIVLVVTPKHVGSADGRLSAER